MSIAMCSLALVAVVACGKPKPAPAPPAPVSSCARVADHVVGLMSGAQKSPPEATDPFRRIVEDRCTSDGWSDTTQRCLLELTALDQGERCQRLMTEPQVEAFVRASQAALADLHSQLEAAPSDAAHD